MVQLSFLNPEQPRQVVLRFLMDSVQPYVMQALGALFQRNGDPFSNLTKMVKRSAGQVAVSLVAAGAAGGATSAVSIWKASLRRPRALGYELGLVSTPLATPLIGGFIGLALGATGAALMIKKLRENQLLATAELHAQIYSVLVYAPGMEEPGRHRILEEIKDRLIGAGLAPDVIESMFVRAPLAVEGLDLDVGAHEIEALRDVLINAWQMTRATGEPPAEVEHVFARLCRRLNLGDEIQQIKTQAQDALEQQSARISAAIEVARHLGADFQSATIDEALDKLIALDPLSTAKQRRQRALHIATDVVAAAGAIAAVAATRGPMLPIIGQAYGAVHAAINGDESATKRLQARALDLLKQLGIKPEDASRFLSPIIETFDVRRSAAADAVAS